MKSVKILSSGLTLASPNLSHMDFPDAPAAITRNRLIISNTTQDESSNEHIDPEIWSNTLISSCVCIVLLFETSSSSHLGPAVNRQPLFPRGGLEELVHSNHWCVQSNYIVKVSYIRSVHSQHLNPWIAWKDDTEFYKKMNMNLNSNLISETKQAF